MSTRKKSAGCPRSLATILVGAVSKTLRRYSAIIGIILIVFLLIKVVNTGYLCLTHSPSDIPEAPPENMYTDSFRQTLGYWGNNLGVGLRGLFLFGLGVPKLLLSANDQANSNFQNHYSHGVGEVWGYLATISVHGIVECAGIFVMAVAGFLFLPAVLVTLWLAFMTQVWKRRGRWPPSVKKVVAFLQRAFSDLSALITLGVILILVAGPIEAYLSWPHLLPVFVDHLWLSLMYFAFLFVLVGWLFFVRFGGWWQVRKFGDLVRKHAIIF
jgi:hypothetical protein